MTAAWLAVGWFVMGFITLVGRMHYVDDIDADGPDAFLKILYVMVAWPLVLVGVFVVFLAFQILRLARFTLDAVDLAVDVIFHKEERRQRKIEQLYRRTKQLEEELGMQDEEICVL